MNNALLEGILTRLDLVVLERLPHGLFLRLGTAPPPLWFSHVIVTAKDNEPVTVAEAIPFLEHFLGEAEPFWRDVREGRLRSEPFTIADPEGGEIGLVASAIGLGHRHFLVLELAADFEERRRSLQTAREHVLEHEDHVRKTGELLTPLGAAQKMAEQLGASGLSAGQQALARSIRDELAAVAASIEALSPLPKGVRRGGR